MQFPKSEYMKLITRIHVEKRLNSEEQGPYNNDKSDGYYSNVIDHFQKSNQYTWNWSSALFQCKWLIYRGMFVYTFLYILLITIPEIICLFLILTNYESLFIFLFIILWILVDPISFLILGKFGNRLYFSFLDKKIKKGWNLIPRKNTHGWLVFSLFYFEWLLLFIIPYYSYKKIIFNSDLKKAKLLTGLNISV